VSLFIPPLLAARASYDWQFWVATAVVACAAAWLLRGVVPVPYLTRRYNRRKHEKRVPLTVSGKSVRP
jgi:hypothetical protein